MKVLFQNSEGIKREIADVSTLSKPYVTINMFCLGYGFNVGFTRSWKQDNVITVDVGSH